ncbi:MAG: red chlorophyll catabolite reductase [Anaerolineales bacterium]|nr:red chlorophyll catabolite reductase [Anaerolineales bacterium]
MVNEHPSEDRSAIFEDLWGILAELRAKMDARFMLHPHPSTADFQPYTSLTGEAKGFLSGFSGNEIDWLIHSYIGNPKASFTNMHLTAWLGAQTRVPHWGMALGTSPDIFLYMDFVPRADLVSDLDYLDRYYEPLNARYLDFQKDPNFSPFVSKSLYMRQSQSATSLCFLCKPRAENVAKIRTTAHAMLDQWIAYVDAAPPVPEDERAALARRDLHVRRAIAERDPANPMGEILFGKPLAERLIRALWGGDR